MTSQSSYLGANLIIPSGAQSGTIDSTSGDITGLGYAAAAGSVGKPADSGHVHSASSGVSASKTVLKSATYSLAATDSVVIATSGTWTATLPTAVGVTGQSYTILNAGTGVITIATTSSQTINALSTATVGSKVGTQYQYVEVVSDGSNWWIIDTAPDTGAPMIFANQSATPSTPASGYLTEYSTSHGHPAAVDDTGVVWMGGTSISLTTSAQTINSATETVVTGLQCSLYPGTYFVRGKVLGLPSVAASTHNVGLVFGSGNTDISSVAITWTSWQTGSSNAITQTTGFTTSLATTGFGVSPTQALFNAWVDFQGSIVVTTANELYVTAAVTTAADTWVLASGASYLQVIPLN